MNAAVTPPNLDDLAHSAGYSRFHFHRLFKSLTGVTPHTYWTAVRTRRVRENLMRARTVSDAIYQAVCNTNGQFYAVSSAILGMTPRRSARAMAGVEIRSAGGSPADHHRDDTRSRRGERRPTAAMNHHPPDGPDRLPCTC
jgi:AraC family transcriptional regulator of adaptative response/methylated-DNA-[protein]-cysteine methyltransferase